MEKTGIISFSLEELEKMQILSEPDDHTFQGCFFVHRSPESVNNLELFRHPCRINAYVAILCTKGTTDMISNMRPFTIRANSLFVSSPNDIIQLISSEGCEFYIMALNDEFAKRMKIDHLKVLSVFLGIQQKPYLEISSEERRGLEETFLSLINDMRLYGDSEFYNEIVLNYISLATYKASTLIAKYREKARKGSDQVTRRNEDHYNRFMELLLGRFRDHHDLAYYASELCITPKYLTSLIRKMSGRSATEWINAFLITEAKHLLKYSPMSIQEISYYLNFPNQSFFAQYFRRLTGVTPRVYRMEP